jgi:hypothetical protein
MTIVVMAGPLMVCHAEVPSGGFRLGVVVEPDEATELLLLHPEAQGWIQLQQLSLDQRPNLFLTQADQPSTRHLMQNPCSPGEQVTHTER